MVLLTHTAPSQHRTSYPASLLVQDRALLAPIEQAFQRVKQQTPDSLPCAAGCGRCCVAFFEITLADVWRLRRGLEGLDCSTRQTIGLAARRILGAAHQTFPHWAPPWDVRDLPNGLDMLAQALVLPCPALSHQQHCQVYEGRPRICRLQGLSYFEPEQPEIVLEDGCAPIFGDDQYALLPAQPLPLLEQWQGEAALRSAVWETYKDTLPAGMTAGYRTVVAGALALLVQEDGALSALFSDAVELPGAGCQEREEGPAQEEGGGLLPGRA